MLRLLLLLVLFYDVTIFKITLKLNTESITNNQWFFLNLYLMNRKAEF